MELTCVLISLSVSSEIQCFGIDEAATIGKSVRCDYSWDLFPADRNLEVDERFVRIDADSICRHAIMHDL